MKRWIVSGLCLCCLFTLFLSGCKTPPKDAPAGQTEPAVQTVDTEEPVQTGGSDLKAANEKLINQASAARQKAVAAGADRYFPNELTVVDTAFAEARSVYDAGGDAAAFNQKAGDIVYQYSALEQASLAHADRKKITDMGFADYARADFNAADAASRKTEEMFNAGADGKDLYEQSKKAADGYRSVLKAGYKALAEKERDKVLALKEKADAIKAAVADKDGYANAVALYTRANQDLQSGDPEKAYNGFVSCYSAVDNVYQGVLKKRAAAQEAMDRAKNRVEESDAVAVKADGIAPVEQVEALAPVENIQSAQEAR